MSNLKIFCVTNKRLNLLENFAYHLCSVGNEILPNQYINCNYNDNIFKKEKYYSELTFHYWYWKNLLNNEKSDWVGFCQKRRFWIKKNSKDFNINNKNILEHLLVEPDTKWSDYNSIICNPIDVSGAKKMKIFKRGWKNVIRNPSVIFDKKKQTLKLHFDMHHGFGNLDKAINILTKDDREEFRQFVNTSNFYNPHIMFIVRPEILDKWFKKLFEWLENCENVFGFESLKGYDTQRLYAYLAERYLSFWFRKYTRSLEWPWIFFDFNNQ